MADELRLVLYALHQQATVGPCSEPKPWGWNVVESAKWESWSQLGGMSSMEAMRLYVKMVEDEQVLSPRRRTSSPFLDASLYCTPLPARVACLAAWMCSLIDWESIKV